MILNNVKSLRVVLFVLVFVGLFYSSGSLVLAAGKETKIAAVDLQRVIDISKPGKAAMEKLGNLAKSSKSRIDKLENELKKMANELSSSSARLTRTQEEKSRDDIRKKERDLQILKEDLQQAFQKEQNNLMKSLFTDIRDAIKSYSDKNGYTLVLEKGNSPSMGGPVVLYSDESIDITDAIVKIIDSKK